MRQLLHSNLVRRRDRDPVRTLRACADSGPARGGHGLPLIGAGDWNDGINRVGARSAPPPSAGCSTPR